MGAFNRSKHELVFVFKQGTAEHTNSFGLGDTGRYRTNVWDYAGISLIGAGRSDELTMHPTVKPVAMFADAIRDCSKRGEIVCGYYRSFDVRVWRLSLSLNRKCKLTDFSRPIFVRLSLAKAGRSAQGCAAFAGCIGASPISAGGCPGRTC